MLWSQVHDFLPTFSFSFSFVKYEITNILYLKQKPKTPFLEVWTILFLVPIPIDMGQTM